MDTMNLFNILTVSVPEAVLNVFVGLLVVGGKRFLKPGKANIFKMLLAVVLMVTSSVTFRAIMPDINIALLVNIIAYIIIIKSVYSVQWWKALTITIFFVGLLITIEGAYMPYCVAFILKNLNNLWSDDITRFIYVLPERLIQIAVVVSLWNWDIILVNLKKYKEIRLISSMYIITLLTVEAIVSFTFVENLDIIALNTKIALSMVCVLFIVINALSFKMITLFTRTARDEGVKKQKRENYNTLAMINERLEKGQIEKAREMCRNSKIKEGVS